MAAVWPSCSMTKSLVVFADFRRDVPLVREIAGRDFCILLNAHDDNVRVRPSWNPTTGHPAFAVLRVHRPSDGLWTVQPHPESPSSQLGLVKVGPAYFPVMEVKSWELDRQLQCGDQFRFVLGDGPDQKAFQMTIFNGNTPDSIERPMENQAVLMMQMNLMNLPNEVLLDIISRLPWHTVVRILPLVSVQMFVLAKNVLTCRNLDLSCAGDFERKDIKAFCSQVHENCDKLTIRGHPKLRPSEPLGEKLLEDVFVPHQWSVLKEMRLKEEAVGGGFGHGASGLRHVRQALESNNFPELEVLNVTRSNRKCVFGWEHLLRAEVPKLKSLTFSVDGRPAEVPDFSQPFTNLEELHVHGVSLKWCILPRVPHNSTVVVFPKLRELKVVTNYPTMGCPDAIRMTFAACREAPIERLSLTLVNEKNMLPVSMRTKVAAEDLFRLLPHLKCLTLDQNHLLVYHKSIFVDLCLGKLRVLKMPMRIVGLRWCELLVGLEEAEFDVRNTFDHPSYCDPRVLPECAEKLAKVICLPKLRVLKLGGEWTLKAFAELDEAVVSGCQVLELDLTYVTWLLKVEEIRSFLNPFRKLRRIVIRKRFFSSDERETVDRLVAEVIPGNPGVETVFHIVKRRVKSSISWRH